MADELSPKNSLQFLSMMIKTFVMSTMFIRSDNLVWFINIGGETGDIVFWPVIHQVIKVMKELIPTVGAPTVIALEPCRHHQLVRM